MSPATTARIAQVVVDVPSRSVDTHFDYTVPESLAGEVAVGSCVLVEFGSRPVTGYVIGLAGHSPHQRLKPVKTLLGGPFFGPEASVVARWLAAEYAAPLSEAVRLFTPPGGTPKLRREQFEGEERWGLRRPGVGRVDDRWLELPAAGSAYDPPANATLQRAVLDSLSAGPVRAAEVAADLGSVDGAIRRLEQVGAIVVTYRRRMRGGDQKATSAPRHESLTTGQAAAIEAVGEALAAGSGVLLLDGVTGSGKTEVYLRAIEKARETGRTACVLVPEISLTPQTVGRFRSRFGDQVAVLHSRLAAGERFDQWDRVASGEASIVVGARSALFAPLRDLGLIIIDEEHEGSYKQGSAPRYHARDVAAKLAEEHGAVLVLGSASPSMESLRRCETGEWRRIVLPERVTGRPLPPVEVVDMGAEFAAGHRSMFSRPLITALGEVAAAGEKAVLFLNRRGFASFLLCRECGFVPTCDSCSTSLTYHDVGRRLTCHHCGSTRGVPATCPRCSSVYLRLFGAGTQRVETELASRWPEMPVVRMDADTTKGRISHERLLAAFEALRSGVLLGTQMIAKGLDYPDVTLVGVVTADITLNLPDFRAGERTYQLLEQVAGRAGRGERQGRVIVQTYWPDHPAIVAAAAHEPATFHTGESAARRELGYPPFGRLANLLVWGRDRGVVDAAASDLDRVVRGLAPDGWSVLGPSPCPLERLKGLWRRHILVKAPVDAAMGPLAAAALAALPTREGISAVADIDPIDLL